MSTNQPSSSDEWNQPLLLPSTEHCTRVGSIICLRINLLPSVFFFCFSFTTERIACRTRFCIGTHWFFLHTHIVPQAQWIILWQKISHHRCPCRHHRARVCCSHRRVGGLRTVYFILKQVSVVIILVSAAVWLSGHVPCYDPGFAPASATRDNTPTSVCWRATLRE